MYRKQKKKKKKWKKRIVHAIPVMHLPHFEEAWQAHHLNATGCKIKGKNMRNM
jgi:hypothetical protein